jgi:hypothetical protein
MVLLRGGERRRKERGDDNNSTLSSALPLVSPSSGQARARSRRARLRFARACEERAALSLLLRARREGRKRRRKGCSFLRVWGCPFFFFFFSLSRAASWAREVRNPRGGVRTCSAVYVLKAKESGERPLIDSKRRAKGRRRLGTAENADHRPRRARLVAVAILP